MMMKRHFRGKHGAWEHTWRMSLTQKENPIKISHTIWQIHYDNPFPFLYLANLLKTSANENKM